jgi:hypothetical protein
MRVQTGPQYYLPHPAFCPPVATAVDGPLRGQTYYVDLTRAFVELIPGVPYRVVEGESGELFYEFAPQAIAYPVGHWKMLDG